MNNKINFFDHLDGGWGDLIADTYKEYNNIMFYDTHRDINLILTNLHNLKVYKGRVNYYEEDYKAQDKDKVNYKIDLTLYMTNTNELKFSVAIQNIDVVDFTNDNYMNISFYIPDERITKDIYSDYIEEIIKIEPTFLKNYLNRARPYINLDATDTINSNRIYDIFIECVLNIVQDPNIKK